MLTSTLKQANVDYFREQLPVLLQNPLLVGKFLVLQGLQVRGVFDTFSAALHDAVNRYGGKGEFVIQQLIPDDAQISFIRVAC